MAIRQYIGARYVPRFAGTYDPTQIYEALDVVDNGSGTSYIARKTVPAGTPLTDSSFWFVYGASSGAIIALQNDMIAAQGNITNLQSDVNTINGNITQIQAELATLESIEGRRFIFIGDSYLGRTDENSHTYVDLFRTALNIDMGNVYEAHAGGASFYHANTALQFESLLASLTGNVTKPETITDIVVVGGANDANYTLSDTVAKIQSFIAYARSEYPRAKITLFPCGLTFTSLGMEKCAQNMLPAWNQGILYGANIAVNAQYVIRDTYLLDSNDLCHPNASGVRAIASALINWAANGGVNVINYFQIAAATLSIATLGSGTPLTLGNSAPLNFIRSNGMINICGNAGSQGILLEASSAINIPAGSGISLTLPRTLFAGYGHHNITYYSRMIDNHGNIYPVAIIPHVVVNSITFDIYISNGVPSANNATSLNLNFTLSCGD